MTGLFMGLDLSTQQLKGMFPEIKSSSPSQLRVLTSRSLSILAVVIDEKLRVLFEERVEFDADLPHHGTRNGVLQNTSQGEIYAPVVMWLEALDLLCERLQGAGLDFSRIRVVSGAGMQHGIVLFSDKAQQLLRELKPDSTLAAQLVDAFAHPTSPNWQDTSTQSECEIFDVEFGGPSELAVKTGSKAHHRFSGPQILRFKRHFPERYAATARISLVSSFLATLFLGRVCSIDRADACGMNLWDIQGECWSPRLLSLAADGELGLESKLGPVIMDSTSSQGCISEYFVKRFGFRPDCSVLCSTGDNPSTMLALPLKEGDAIVSLGTSSTFLMSTGSYEPSPEHHVMNHPTTPGLYMFMLCYKNGSLARERIRDQINESKNARPADPWAEFNRLALAESGTSRLGLYYHLPEIVPAVKAGTWRATVVNGALDLHSQASYSDWAIPDDDARAILESQFLSMRLRSAPQTRSSATPGRLRRLYLAGGASVNAAVASIAQNVLGPTDGVYRLSLGANACALGAAYKAAWAYSIKGDQDQSFEDYLGENWDEEAFVVQIYGSPSPKQSEAWARYGNLLGAFQELEERAEGKS